MQTHGKEDPRVKRTRKVLIQALEELLAEKRFHAISVQDIAERAEVNRVTFYGHFSDKYAILEYWLRRQFQQQIANTGLTVCVLNVNNLQTLSVVLTKWFAQLHRRAKPDDSQLLPLLFTTMQQELSLLLMEWVRHSPVEALPPHTTLETIVMVISWAIFGTSLQWAHGERSLSPEELAKQVTALLMASF
jgi:AcrR family transcriptional regulator